MEEVSDRKEANIKQLLELTAAVVAAYVVRNPIQASDLPGLIADVHRSLVTVSASGEKPDQSAPVTVPAVNPKKSVFADYLVSLEDGKRYKTLKRHLGLRGMTPEQYRAKWDLPANYPMVAPSYAAKRSQIARELGLGSFPRSQFKRSANA